MSMNLLVSSLILMFLMGVMSFLKSYGQLLLMLISLEFMVLMIFCISLLSVVSVCYYISVVLLIFSVCEGALGLTILVTLVRSFSGDYLNSFYLSY